MDSNLVVNFRPKENVTSIRTSSRWLTLEQVNVDSLHKSADLSDVSSMYARARSGLSAHTYTQDNCPVLVISDTTATITLSFYVWPSSLDLIYGLTAPVGVISSAERVDVSRSFEAFFNNTTTVELPWIIDGSVVNETAFYDQVGNAFSPIVTMENSIVMLSEPASCVLWVSGDAQGYKYTLTVDIDIQANVRLNEAPLTIIANWVGVDGLTQTATLDLEVPDCVISALDQCPDNSLSSGKDETTKMVTIYYSDCTGRIMDKVYSDEQE